MHKNDFPIFTTHSGLVYLDNAATAQKPAAVIDGVKNYLENDYANIHRGQYMLSETSELLYRKARQTVARFLGSDEEEVIFTANSTDAVNKLVKSLILSGRIGSGDKVLLSDLEHHANIVPWLIAAKQHGVIIEYIGLDEEDQIDMQDLNEKCDERTKIVSLTMISNVTGGKTDIEKINNLFKKKNNPPLLILDASQAAPHIQLDVQTLGADFLYFTGHKVGALTGIGVLRGKKEHLQMLDPAFGGGGMVDEVSRHAYTLQGSPDKFEPGTPNVVGAHSLGLALSYMEQTGSFATFFQQLTRYEEGLMKYCLSQFARYENQGLTLLGPKNLQERVGVFSFLLPPGKNTTALGAYMASENICIRCGAQCAHIFHSGLDDRTEGKSCIQQSCRMSLRGYNDFSDIELFFATLERFLG